MDGSLASQAGRWRKVEGGVDATAGSRFARVSRVQVQPCGAVFWARKASCSCRRLPADQLPVFLLRLAQPAASSWITRCSFLHARLCDVLTP
ncbi:hypothetical protein GUJ93_ZPchr0001g30025 [Zizania palustris]|uniref:Uncharacterized protein n=1 Tax=Zizania palustris TaxID=103762 RepID=A0A8J5RWX6_ZIZPA|nr:hypothetical protein GUJ93_ZPchr0001g30025 [Zizania palustris]